MTAPMNQNQVDERALRFARPIRVGMIGGGVDSVIGWPHRLGQAVSERFSLVAGAFSIDPRISMQTGQVARIEPDRTYADWRDLIANESARADGIEALVVATPPHLHAVMVAAGLEAGMHVLCEKPFTATLEEAERLQVAAAEQSGVLAVAHFFAGYPMIREAKALIEQGAIGDIRLVEATFAMGFAPDDLQLERSQRHWRWRPEAMGKAAILGEVGSHAHHMVEYLTGSSVAEVSATLETVEPGREVYDNAYLQIRLDNGATGRIWNSYGAAGNEHGFTIRLYGSEGSLGWAQEDPEHIDLRDWTGRRTRLSRGASYSAANTLSQSRFPAGHPEGWGFAIANIYRAWADRIMAQELGEPVTQSFLPSIAAGVAGMRFYEAAERSSNGDGRWTKL